MKYFIVLSLIFTSCFTELDKGRFYKKVGNYNLEYMIKGDGPILIVGHPTSGKIAYENSLQNLEKYFTVVYYNSRGIGKSETPKTYEEYQDKYLVEEIDNLRKKLKADKIWIFGHSDQSALALQYAIDYSNHLSGLIISGTGFVESFDKMIEERKISEQNRINNSEWFNQVVKDWDSMMKNNKIKDSLGRDLSYAPIKWWCYNENSFLKVKPMYDSIQKVGKRKEILNEIDTNSTEKNINDYIVYQNKINQINIPILIINGKYDTNNPLSKVEKLNSKLPNSTLYIIDKSGHFPWIEQKEITFDLIEKWLIKYL